MNLFNAILKKQQSTKSAHSTFLKFALNSLKNSSKQTPGRLSHVKNFSSSSAFEFHKFYKNLGDRISSSLREKLKWIIRESNELFVYYYLRRFRSFLRTESSYKSKFFASFSAIGFFKWDDHKLSDENIRSEVNEILSMFDENEPSASKETKTNTTTTNKISTRIDLDKSRSIVKNDWELIFDKKDLLIWRRGITLEEQTSENQVVDYDLYEYKVLGRINDLTPIEFFQTQVDLNYRRKWDYLVLYLEIMDKDAQTNTELLRWLMKFPYPLYPREYIFVRRFCLDPNENLLVLVSRSVPECNFDEQFMENVQLKMGKRPKEDYNTRLAQSVLVTKFKSNMIIIPKVDLDQQGLIYIMQYYDVNKAKIPKVAYKWMAASGLPDFIDKVHKATLKHRSEANRRNMQKFIDSIDKLEIFERNEEPKIEEAPSNPTSEETKSELSIEEKQSKDTQANEQIDNEQQVKTGDKSEINREKLKKHTMKIIEKLNKDYFDRPEPHPLFFHIPFS